jgi:tetratricopeptide (TPR) repeat protein
LTDEELFQTNELSRPASSRLVHRGQQQAERGDLPSAAKTLQRAVELDPQPAALELLGALWIRLNQPERAIIPLAAAITLDPKGGAASALAHAFMLLRREREAHAMATLALERRPGDRQALEVLEATRDGE